MSDMHEYKCRKIVKATKIEAMENCIDFGYYFNKIKIIPEDKSIEPIIISKEWLWRCQATPGGYYVNDHGFETYISEKEFERDYEMAN